MSAAGVLSSAFLIWRLDVGEDVHVQADRGFRFALVDFDAAFNDLFSAADDTAIRRTTRALLACMYELRSARENQDRAGYQAAEKASPEGEVVLALNAVRGKFTHLLMHEAGPQRRELFPSRDLYPSEKLLPGLMLRWRPSSEIAVELPELASDVRFPLYTSRLDGEQVHETFDLARKFLTDGVTF